VKKAPVLPKLVPQHRKREENQTNSFVFFNKSSGFAQFQADSGTDRDNTIERLASLLAMQCLVRGSEPTDFAILIPVEKTLAERMASRAKELLEEGRAVANPASLSPRQKEILHSVLRNRANKEIACKLNITVRTVKFHISTLLSKFGVENRTELARRATGFMQSAMASEDDSAQNESPLHLRRQDRGMVMVSAPVEISAKSRGARFQPRVMTA
jgi:DNA-binding CsgD family transcriptional regulator